MVARSIENAITDAATALQEALKAIGAVGSTVSALAKSARNNGVLGPHDDVLVEAIHKIAVWVEADRSTTGDAHNARPAMDEDAWFAVHVVGAMILRLTGAPRPATS